MLTGLTVFTSYFYMLEAYATFERVYKQVLSSSLLLPFKVLAIDN